MSKKNKSYNDRFFPQRNTLHVQLRTNTYKIEKNCQHFYEFALANNKKYFLYDQAILLLDRYKSNEIGLFFSDIKFLKFQILKKKLFFSVSSNSP